MGKYVAVTIGPIFETLMLSSKPVSLWASSYFFSMLSKNICCKLVEDNICKENDIVTPYFDNESVKRTDGVGVFHDHVIFKCDKEASELNCVFDEAIETTAASFGVNYDYIKKFVYVFACNFESDANSIIISCSKMLDCMELNKRFSTLEKKNDLLERFNNESINEMVKDLEIEPEKFQLLKRVYDSYGVKSLPEIAHSDYSLGYKRNNYYCLLRADGDNMSKILSELKSENDCRAFSKKCLEYCDKVAKTVGAYGGVTIYAGGDDLLALTPCVNDKGITVFDLMEQIKGVFFSEFKDYVKEGMKVGLSFGLFISYEKYPLYEALEKSAELLYGVAKNNEIISKNCVALNLQKHSGQSAEFIISNDALSSFSQLLNQVVNKKDTDEKVFLSAGQKVSTFKSLFDCCDESSRVLFENTFDSDFHLNNSESFFHDKLPEFYDSNILTRKIGMNSDDSRADSFAAVLRVIKFFVEKGVEQ